MLNKNPTLKRMLHVALHIPTANWYPELEWFYQDKYGENFSLTSIGLDARWTPEELQSCGTLACLAGWLAVDPEINPVKPDPAIPECAVRMDVHQLGNRIVSRLNRAAARDPERSQTASGKVYWTDLFSGIGASRYDPEIPGNRILRQLVGQQKAKMTAVYRIYRAMGYAQGDAMWLTIEATKGESE